MASPGAGELGGAARSSPQRGRGAGRGGQGPNDGIEMEQVNRNGTQADQPIGDEEETTRLLEKHAQPPGGDEFEDGQALLDFADGRKRKNAHMDKCMVELEQREKDRREKEKRDALLDPDVEEMKAREAIAVAMTTKEATIPEEFHKLVDVINFTKSPGDKLKEVQAKESAKYEKQPEFDSAFMAEVRTKVLEAELTAAKSKGLKVEQDLLETFEKGAHDSAASITWLNKAARSALVSNGHLHKYMNEAERTKSLFDDSAAEADPDIMKEYKAVTARKADVATELQALVAEVEAQTAKEEEEEATKRAQTEMAAKDTAEEKLAQAKLAAKIKELRLKTISPNPKEYYVRIPLRLRRQVVADRRNETANLHATARERWFACERAYHWLFLGDVERVVTSDEKYWDRYLEEQSELRKRRDRNPWSPYQAVQHMIVENVGGNVAQTFTYYQFIMDNNFVMSNMWTFFVILPFFLNPPPWFDMSKITWAGLSGMDDKGLEYSWFYYGAYPTEIDIGGWAYPMGTMYVVVYLLMFFFQLSVMMGGVFESIFDDMSIEKVYDDPYEGIGFISMVLNCPNHCIMNRDVKYTNKRVTILHLRRRMAKLAAEEAEMNAKSKSGGQRAPIPGDEPEDPRLKKAKIIIGRTFGCLAYIGLFQISTNGIQLCYQNEEAINEIMPYAVPVLVTAQRVLVPFLMVPFLLGFEYREEPNLFYHTIIRMFALKVYTMNVILQVLLSTPVPGGICRAIFIGKVYWRQEIVDLVFCLILDVIMTIIRLQKPVLPEFDEEELAERVMELLYRQAFIWVSAPYSPMLAYLGLCSTSILYFWQSITIPLSYAPPTKGWSVKQANKDFRVQLLCTAVATFLPTTIFLHQDMDCGPHVTANTTSPYAYIEGKVETGPASLRDMTYWLSVPSTSMSLLCASIGLQVFLSAVSVSRTFKLNAAIDKLGSERHDKLQLLRSAGMKI